MRRRILPALFAVVVAAISTASLAGRPAGGALADTVDYVVIVGAAGLRWDDVDPINTPTLWRAAEEGSIGSLSVRSAHQPTCPADGWLTLGAGNFAARHQGETTGPCPPVNVRIGP